MAPAASSRICRRRYLAHSDGAQAIAFGNPQGILHDAVPHSTSRSRPKAVYARPAAHVLPNGSVYNAVGGTQSLDGWWKHGKKALGQTNARYTKAVDLKLREAQWHHWLGNDDPWTASGEVISWLP